MARSITVIPSRANRTSLAENIVLKKVAAYCRVSTDQAEQLSSYEAQVIIIQIILMATQIMSWLAFLPTKV